MSQSKGMTMIRAIAIGGPAAAAALLLVATSVGGNRAASALRGVVGPAFTMKLMKAGKVVKSLKGRHVQGHRQRPVLGAQLRAPAARRRCA
jgi:hypothetical protein